MQKRRHRIESENDLNGFTLLEKPIDLSVQKAYLDLSDSMYFDNVDCSEVLNEADKLLMKNTTIETKKRILVALAHLGTMESSRVIEKYLNRSDGELRDWALLALQECRMFLEGVLLKEESGFISTALGGKHDKLRYYFIVGTRQGQTLTEADRITLIEGFERGSAEYRSENEEIHFGADYAMIRVMVPIDVSVGEVIEEGIRQCNRVGEILLSDYYVTNVKKPTREDILKYLTKIRRKKVGD